MTLLRNGGEVGTAGATVSATNSGGGAAAALNNIVIGTGAAVTFDTAQHAHGLQAFNITPASAGVAFVGWSGLSTGQIAVRAYVYITAVPAVGFSLLQVRSAGAQAATLILNSTGKLGLNNAAGTGIWTAAAAVPLNAWVRLEMEVAAGTDTLTGTINARYATLDSTTITDSFASSAVNSGTANFTETRVGKLTGTNTVTFWLDDLAAQDGTTTPLGPWSSTTPNAPTGVTAAAGAQQATVSWAAPGYDGGSAVTGYTATASPGGATATAGAGGTSATVTGLTAGSAYTFTVHATNANGDGFESAASNSVTPTAAPQYGRPSTDITATGWSGSVTASPLATLIDETSLDDTDYITSPANPSGSVYETRVTTLATPADNNGWSVQVRARYRSGTSGSAVIALVQGATVIASSTVTLTGSFATYTLNVTSAQAGNITNLADLRIRVTATAA